MNVFELFDIVFLIFNVLVYFMINIYMYKLVYIIVRKNFVMFFLFLKCRNMMFEWDILWWDFNLVYLMYVILLLLYLGMYDCWIYCKIK